MIIVNRLLLFAAFCIAIVAGFALEARAFAESQQSPDGAGSSIQPGGSCIPVPVIKVPGQPDSPRVVVPNLTGTYSADDGGLYYMQQSGSTLWWAGLSVDPKIALEQQWHRGLDFTNVFSGTIFCNGQIVGKWVNVPRGVTLSSGTLSLAIDTSSGSTRIKQLPSVGGFAAKLWQQRSPVNDLVVYPGVPPNPLFPGLATSTFDIYDRFNRVDKNTNETILKNLKPYRDQTVVYGHVITKEADILGNQFGFNMQPPHVNFGVTIKPNFFNLPDFGHKDRSFSSFCGDQGDGDFDFRLRIDMKKRLEPDFLTTGWGNQDVGPAVFTYKFAIDPLIDGLGLAPDEAYLGAEVIMYGRDGGCGSSLLPGSNQTPAAMLPGWADLAANSVLINGRPMNGSLPSPHLSPQCIFIQPCPYGDPSQVLNNGIQLGNLLISAKGPPTYMRVTGTLVLDCGHSTLTERTPCYDNPDDPPTVRGHQNQEMHPIYSIDIIDPPFRPEDEGTAARKNLTGSWGGSDGSTYYVRQIGNTIWWLGQMRDRQPMQRGTRSPMIGSMQLAPAFSVNDPFCASNPPQCWAFANVFEGKITELPDGSAKIQGTWAGVPQSTSLGSSGGRMTFVVNAQHKRISPSSSGTIFPTIDKMYEPEDTIPPKSTATVFPATAPAQPSGAHQPAGAGSGAQVTVAKQVSINATDQGAGVQNIWYRFYRTGTTPLPVFTFIAGPVKTFILSGTTGTYAVDFYATDNAGNDETPHSVTVTFQTNRP
jgi:hypothetical protein